MCDEDTLSLSLSTLTGEGTKCLASGRWGARPSAGSLSKSTGIKLSAIDKKHARCLLGEGAESKQDKKTHRRIRRVVTDTDSDSDTHTRVHLNIHIHIHIHIYIYIPARLSHTPAYIHAHTREEPRRKSLNCPYIYFPQLQAIRQPTYTHPYSSYKSRQ